MGKLVAQEQHRSTYINIFCSVSIVVCYQYDCIDPLSPTLSAAPLHLFHVIMMQVMMSQVDEKFSFRMLILQSEILWFCSLQFFLLENVFKR